MDIFESDRLQIVTTFISILTASIDFIDASNFRFIDLKPSLRSPFLIDSTPTRLV